MLSMSLDEFLSPPVRMHGGLICITFCPWLDRVSDLIKSHILVNVAPRVFCKLSPLFRAQLPNKFPYKSRWAHFNVKLHFYTHYQVLGNFLNLPLVEYRFWDLWKWAIIPCTPRHLPPSFAQLLIATLWIKKTWFSLKSLYPYFMRKDNP